MPVDAPLYPVGLVVAGRACLVVGGGAVAARKADGLRACGARVTVVAPHVVAEVAALAATGGVSVERRPYRRSEARAYRLVITAADDPAVNQAVHDDAEAAGVWVNSADDPARCTFTLPAVVRREPVVVAVSTGGTSPALASWLRDEVADRVAGPEVVTAAGLLADARRRVREAGRSTEALDWRPLLEALLGALRGGGTDAGPPVVEAWLAGLDGPTHRPTRGGGAARDSTP